MRENADRVLMIEFMLVLVAMVMSVPAAAPDPDRSRVCIDQWKHDH